MTIHKLRNTSRSNNLHPLERSALDKNFNANANSKKPSVTFTALSQPPDFPKIFSFPGKNAKNAKGKASASENPNIPTSGPQ